MKYKEVKKYYKSGQLQRHYFIDESASICGEHRVYHDNGQLWWHYFRTRWQIYGEIKRFNADGTLRYHYLKDSKGNELATVIDHYTPDTQSEEQLIEIAKEHNLPLLSELPKTEAEVTLWNLKWPDCPCLPIESK